MSETKSSSGGIGFCGLLTVAFIVLKLCKVIDWSWWWVTCALWGPFAILTAYYAIRLAVLIIAIQFEDKERRRRQKQHFTRIVDDQNRSSGRSKWRERMEETQKAKQNN